MSAVYSKRMLVMINTSALQQSFVPAGKVWVVKQISVVCRSGIANDWIVFGSGAVPVVMTFRLGAAAQLQSFNWGGMHVFYAGEAVQLSPQQGTWDGAIAGYELTA